MSEYSDTQTANTVEELIAQNGAVDFNNGGIDLGDFAIGGEITLQAWVNLDGNTQSNMARIFDLANGAADENILLAFGTNNKLYVSAFDGSNQIAGSSSSVIPSTGWQHITMTISNSGFATVYLNGEEFYTLQTYAPNAMARTSNYLGDSNWSADPYFNGLMGEARIYDRMLTQAEIKTSMVSTPDLNDADLALSSTRPRSGVRSTGLLQF